VISQVLLKKKGGGRVAAHEIMVGTTAVRNLIRENKVPQIYSMIQVGQRYGMQTMEDGIRKAVESGLVDAAVAAEITRTLSDEGMSTAAVPAGTAAPRPQPAAPAPAPAAAEAPKKSRSLF
jgi:twitching motility protein PilT